MATRIGKSLGAMRKAPLQARSRATVEAIVTAGARVLGARGWAEFTTNEVAEVAGVSIGSLYQYFPDKLALVEAIRHRHFADVLRVLRAAVAKAGPFEARIAALVDGMIAIHGYDPRMHRALLDDAPRSSRAEAEEQAFKTEYLAAYRELLRAGGARRGQNETIAAQVLSAAVAGAVHDAARRGALGSTARRNALIGLVRACVSEAAPAKGLARKRTARR